MLLRELLIGIGFDVDSKDLDKVEGKIGKFKGFVTKLGAVVTGASAAISSMAYVTSGMATELFNTASGLSLTTSELQKLHHAGKLAGVSTDDMNSALESLNSSVLGVLEGNQSAITAFARFGVSVVDINGKVKNTDDLLLELSDNFKKMPDGPRKAAIAIDVFGSAGSRMFRFLNQGSKTIKNTGREIEKLGGILSKKAITNSLKFTDSIKRLGSFIAILYRNIAQKLLPIVTDVVDSFALWLKQNKKIINSGIELFFKAIIFLISEVWRWLKYVLAVMGFFIRQIEKLKNVSGDLVTIMKTLISLLGLGAVGALTVLAVKTAAVIAFLVGLNGGIKATIIALSGMAAAALKAWAAILGPVALVAAKFIAIGAAISFVVLAIQDLWAYFTNPEAETWTDKILKSFKKNAAIDFKNLFKFDAKTFVTILDFLLNLKKKSIEVIDKTKSYIQKQWSGALDFIFGGGLENAAKTGLDKIKNWFIDSMLSSFNAIVTWASDKLKVITDIVQGVTGMVSEKASGAKDWVAEKLGDVSGFFKTMVGSPTNEKMTKSPRTPKPPSPSIKTSNNQTNVSPNVNVTVNAKTSASAKDIGKQTAEEITKVLTRQNFNANIATQTAVEY